jgi:putative endonuclease
VGGGNVTTGRQRLGTGAERAAADYLAARGYRVLVVNQRVGRGEIDIIARRGPVLVFAEVKARRSLSCGAPEDAVTARKRRQVARLAELWLAARPGALAGVAEVRFDILAVDFTTAPAQIRHLPAAFEGGG